MTIKRIRWNRCIAASGISSWKRILAPIIEFWRDEKPKFIFNFYFLFLMHKCLVFIFIHKQQPLLVCSECSKVDWSSVNWFLTGIQQIRIKAARNNHESSDLSLHSGKHQRPVNLRSIYRSKVTPLFILVKTLVFCTKSVWNKSIPK